MSEIRPEWIAALASQNAQERAKAATEIYRVGDRRAGAAVESWWQSAELAGLCGQTPRPTVGLAVQPVTFAEVPREQDASEFELHFAGGIKLDVLTTRDPEASGAIARYLAKQGEGIQQVEFPCENVDRAAAILRQQFGVQPVYPAKRPGAEGTSVNFFLVTAADGRKELIELYEGPGSEPR